MTVGITATPEPSYSPPRIRLDVTSDQASVLVYRVAPDGTRSLVRTYDGGPLTISAGTALMYDNEAPYGVSVTYTADGAGVTNSAAVNLSNIASVWLVHPGVPVRSLPVRVGSFGPRERSATQAVRYPLGRQFPIVASDGKRKAATYEMTLVTLDLEELSDLEGLLADLSPLLLNVPAEKGWGLTSEYVAVGTLTEARLSRVAALWERTWTLPCTVVARPTGGSQAQITYAYSENLYPTYTDRLAAHATYAEALDP